MNTVYTPQTSYEKETILNIASVIVHCENVGTVDQRIAYNEAYLKQRYGDNPLADNVPEYFKIRYNTDKGNDALDLDVWASVAMSYVARQDCPHRFSLKKELKNVAHKATKKLRKFIKKN